MRIRRETPSDYTYIEALTYQAFENHPHHELGALPTEHLIVKMLRDAGALHLSLIAENEPGIVGHIAFSPIMINKQNCQWFGLGPVSVAPSHQRAGIGSKLIRKGIAILEQQGAKGIVLVGEPEYYNRFDFKTDNRLSLPNVPNEYFLVLPLAGSSDNIPSGEVTYHSAFH